MFNASPKVNYNNKKRTAPSYPWRLFEPLKGVLNVVEAAVYAAARITVYSQGRFSWG